ncbi:hypothetical protein BX666DRAFT_2032324 [Dichotomocladium elegans]|nr:hypothetical protein BX666DRAFT_2032324 [Dichotomocladium elegans]
MSTRREFGSGQSSFNKGRQPRLGSTRANTSLQRYGLPTGNDTSPTNLDQKFEDARKLDELEARFGFERYKEGPERLGWLINMHATIVPDSDWAGGRAGVDYYFLEEDGSTFKVTLTHSPYFYIGCKSGTEAEVEEYLHRRFENTIERLKRVQKEDLKQPNHLIGRKRILLQLFFRNVSDLLTVRRVLLPIAMKNQQKIDARDTYAEVVNETNHIAYEHNTGLAAISSRKNPNEAIENIIDIREYDVPYYVRVAIDLDIRVGMWYTVKALPDETIILTREHELVHRPDPVVLAFDIETTKLPLKFPDSSIDSIVMISYMIDGQGYLITNRDIVSQDIEDFEYTPKPEYEGPFTIFNEANEYDVLMRFFEHIQSARPTIFVTYNGDFFDWPFIEDRSKANGIDMYDMIGVYKDEEDEYKCKHASHMDAFRWVKRDSYLPQGSQGLKAVTKAKLGYNPLELDPEDMTRFASEQPQTLSQYSVSDAVATYYLYMKYVHPFIFSLCNILPLVPDEVLRKGTGTLCELLLMVEAYKVNVIIPNKHVEDNNTFFEGHLIESETYVGGHVEALEAGVFRSDINADFKIDPTAAQELIDQLDDALKFTIEVEEKQKIENIVDYDEVRDKIKTQLEQLRDNPIRHEGPLIYHLDVAAMYPNIILTNRLQPDAMIEESTCATCEFNRPGKTCDRRLTWSWRGEYFPAKRNEYNMIRNQLSTESFPPKNPKGPQRSWHSLSEAEQTTLLHKRLTDYCKKVYKKVRETKTIERESIVCQRENPFYIETVRAFRDRRYEYKGLHKKWKGNMDKAASEGAITKVEEAKKMIVLYDSLQLAHKCILNSFYGYVMRKGARWHSLEMAGIVCLTGSKIIQLARQLVERIGRPLELDTDGIWCILPKSFPETFSFNTTGGKKIKIYYPCTMLNHLVHAKFTNHQYQTLVDPKTLDYSVHSENSIFFEIDGPYRAMILPASTFEDKLLKKRYAVFNDDGSLAELKGFEVKRRGELKLIKIFQEEIFKIFLEGRSLEECYGCVAQVANRWLDILDSKGQSLHDEELFELISENRSMSKTLTEYGTQKSTAICTARRLAEFLGDQMVKDKGLACQFIVSAQPHGTPVSERAVPVAIFSAEPGVKKHYLRKWLRDNSLKSFDIRDIIDWPYYKERFGSVIQKLITIPAAMQKVHNPVPRVPHPDWLHKRVAAKEDKFKQHRITDMFKPAQKPPPPVATVVDIEMQDIEELSIAGPRTNSALAALPRSYRVQKRKFDKMAVAEEDELPEEDRPENMPDMLEDYTGFLAYQKRKWRRQRIMRTKKREVLSANPLVSQNGASNYFRRQTGSLTTSTWEILQIAETDTPGEYKMWVALQDNLRSVKLSVPRIFYLNSRCDRPEEIVSQGIPCQIAKCMRTLPRSHQCQNLYEMIMSEEVYQSERRKLTSIFNDTSTEGVYETQVPLDVRALLLLGTHCEVNKNAAMNGMRNNQYGLLDLNPCLDMTKNYMSQPNRYQYVYLHHAHSDSRHFITLVGSALPKSYCFVVGVSGSNNQKPNIKRIYSDVYNEAIANERSTTVELKESIDFDMTFFPSERKALQAVQKVLTHYQDNKRGPAIIAIRSPRSMNYLVQQVRALNEFPCITLPSESKDNTLQTLSWLQPAFQQAIQSYFGLGKAVDLLIAQSRYANIPFCNIPEDPHIFMADILFARKMMKSDMLLWWSSGTRPDLGGREDDENSASVDELESPEICNPAVYHDVCLEFDILRLCLNTLIAAPVINELEGTSGVAGFDSVVHSLDEYSSGLINTSVAFGDGTVSGKTFSILRSLVQEWLQDVMGNSNLMGEAMLDSIHRWLQSTQSNMHDPCLYGLIHGMMKKVFMQLIAEIKRTGSTIVFANFHRLLIATSKETMDTAGAYKDYLLRSVHSKQLFEVLELRLVDYWFLLVYMDEMNYGGIITRPGEELDPKVTMDWNICEYLPPAVQGIFQKMVAMFISKAYQLKVDHPRGIRLERMEIDEEAGNIKEDDTVEERVQLFRDFMRETIMSKLLRFVNTTLHKQDQSEAYRFPQLSGSYLDLTNPALECTKSVCAVFGLDTALENEVRIVKRNALQSIGGMSDFSPDARFQNPCQYIKLRDVICSKCNFATDLDVCRDRNFTLRDGQPQPWRCHSCGAEYDKNLIEQHMLSLVERWLTAYQLQDVQCQRCRIIKRENLLKQCDRCGSEFVGLQSKTDVERRLKVFHNIAQEQKFIYLSEVVKWTLSNL